MRPDDVVFDVLRRAGLSRSLLPVRLPGCVLVPLGGAPAAIGRMRAELLAAVRRRFLYHRITVAAQLFGAALAWMGVVVAWQPVTLAGVAVVVAGAVLELAGKDRLQSLDGRVGSLHAALRTGTSEWLSMTLEVGPYSYKHVGPSGTTKRGILEGRRDVMAPGVADLLMEWLGSSDADAAPSDRWSRLCADLAHLAALDERGHVSRRRLEVAFDVAHAAMLLSLILVAAATAVFAWPDAGVAAVATFIVVSSRAAHDVTLSMLGGSVPSSAGVLPSATWRRFCDRSVAELTESDVDVVCDASFLVPRTLRRRRTSTRADIARDGAGLRRAGS